MSLVVALRVEHGQWRPGSWSRAYPGGADEAGTYEDGRMVVSLCTVTGCGGDAGRGGGGGGHTSTWMSQSARDSFLVVTVDGAAKVTASDGWRVRVAAPVTFRAVGAMGSRASGVNAGVARYEQYRGTSAPGGRYGSIAWARLPCSYSGSGSGVLKAVRRPVAKAWPMECATPSRGTYGGFGWDGGHAVNWVVEADVEGFDDSSERLFVLDLPKRPAARR